MLFNAAATNVTVLADIIRFEEKGTDVLQWSPKNIALKSPEPGPHIYESESDRGHSKNNTS